jgi:NhaP-type Na+/H+ or K+/H+ antiporter
MTEQFPLFLSLIIAIVALVMIANKIKVAYPVVLVVAGLLISFMPFIPPLHIDPEVIFIMFLPPLLYEASWTISWKELWRWRRIISSFAFVVVFLTAISVAFAANHFIFAGTGLFTWGHCVAARRGKRRSDYEIREVTQTRIRDPGRRKLTE